MDYHRITQVMTNGTTDKVDGLTYDAALTLFDLSANNPNIIYVAWLQLTDRDGWDIINQAAKYAGE